MRIILTIVTLLIITMASFATHNRAGEITYRQIDELTYEVTIMTFTYTLSQADRPDLEVQWGDNTTSIVDRVEEVLLPNYYKRNRYVGTHTFPGPGVYEIVMMDQNRNDGVENIPGSVNVPFTIKTTIMINPQVGYNNTPILLNPPIDLAAVGQIFIHNPAAYDPDGDSLSYSLSVCLGFDGEEIDGYSLPPSSDSITVNERTGDLIWNTPVFEGIYNVAILIEEWRDGLKIGRIVRDMQIEVYDSENHPPQLQVSQDTCVVADSSISVIITATDVDDDNIYLFAWGGPLYLDNSPAVFTELVSQPGFAKARLTWNTNCGHIRRQPYQIVFKAQDNNPDLDLVDLKTLNIKVICPAPENLGTIATNNTVNVSWSPSHCTNIAGYHIYRRTGPYNFTPDICETGIPSYTGYSYIGSTSDWSDTTYLDDNHGQGLIQGYEYCYRVISYCTDHAESYSSEEICTMLIRGIPIITKVSVDTTDTNEGQISVEWAKPAEFDTILAQGPYKYLIYRSETMWGQNLVLIDSLSGIDDTTYTDTGLNTKDTQYSYKVEFWNDGIQGRFLIGSPQVASSVFLTFNQSDNALTLIFNKNVPWQNEEYTVYRLSQATASFDSIGTTDTVFYVDNGLPNGQEFCYKVRSSGKYYIDNIVHPLINYSQINCDNAVDTIPSCPPILQLESDCDSLRRNVLTWTNPNDICSDDVIYYKIYYAPFLSQELQLIDTVSPASALTYTHFPQISMAGCYMVTAVDSFLNESTGNKLCIDLCDLYELPDVFTPNGDGYNDLYHPGPYFYVEKVDMKIYNRWGQLVFETADPDINWDGLRQDNQQMVTSGVYYYICDVYEQRLTGVEPRTITGFIHVFTDAREMKY